MEAFLRSRIEKYPICGWDTGYFSQENILESLGSLDSSLFPLTHSDQN